jgi:threonyl-tRNA synthetase
MTRDDRTRSDFFLLMNSSTIDIRFPDGSVKQFPGGVTGMEIALGISPRLAKAALSIEVNGEVRDLARPITGPSSVRILKWEDEGGKSAYWHSSAHLMAEAVEGLFPGTKFGIGPTIDNGFYYDLDMGDHRLSHEDLEAIEKRMRELSARDVPFVRRELSWDEAVAYFTEKGDPYKLDLLEGLKDQQISFYSQGDFTDLCYGPHIPSTGRIKAVKLLSVAGAYWRGDEKNKMLQRIYGIAFPSDAELQAYVQRLEEAKKRDHRKLGRELDLFVFHDVAPGAPFWLPKGMIIFRELEKFLRAELDVRGYEEINTPILVKKDLWEQSGHWAHYRENMFCVEADDTVYSLKPMNCPESTYAYRHKLRSYKDLPLRFSEIGRLHRNEVSGALGGMFRVRQITMDDAHIYCRPDQILSEISGIIDLISDFYGVFGLEPKYHLSTRPDDAMGEARLWDVAEESLKNGLESRSLTYQVKPKDGAFYGPKIDVQIEDAIGRSWQVATIQLDFVMLPERFDLEYIAEDGSRQRPVAIHRAIFGSFERFIGIITEHFAGDFPLWLAPVQAAILPITDAQHEYAAGIHAKFRKAGVRVEFDDRNEKIGYKIREWELKKVPFMVIIGDKERGSGNLSVRQRRKGDLGQAGVDEFMTRLLTDIARKTLTAQEN